MKTPYTMVCPHCERTYVPDLAAAPDFQDRKRRYNSGELAQDVWPEATLEQREQIISGVCSDRCWDELFPPPSDED